MTLKAGIALILMFATNAFADSVMAPAVAVGSFKPVRKPAANASLLNNGSIADQTGNLSGGTLDSSLLAAPSITTQVSTTPKATVIAPAAPIIPVVSTAPPIVQTAAPTVAAPSAPSMPIPDASLFSQPANLVKPWVQPNDYNDAKIAATVNQPCLTCQAQQKLERIPIPRARPSQRIAAQQAKRATPSGDALPHAEEIQENLKYGPGAGKNMCGRAVFRILCKAGLVKGNCNGVSGVNNAKDFGPQLLAKNGFVKDMSVCNRPGVVRVYNGDQTGLFHSMAGDTAGHIEIFGLDRQYHSFYSSPRSITQSMQDRYGYGQRRPLQSCWYHP